MRCEKYRNGEEVVQLYIRDELASMVEPAHELEYVVGKREVFMQKHGKAKRNN